MRAADCAKTRVLLLTWADDWEWAKYSSPGSVLTTPPAPRLDLDGANRGYLERCCGPKLAPRRPQKAQYALQAQSGSR
eukprot:1485220-Pyramimonas_sp.AAC.1